jgi:hypothetical protein
MQSGRAEVKLSMCLIKYYMLKTNRGVEVYISAVIGEMIDNTPHSFALRGRIIVTNNIGDFVQPLRCV